MVINIEHVLQPAALQGCMVANRLMTNESQSRLNQEIPHIPRVAESD